MFWTYCLQKYVHGINRYKLECALQHKVDFAVKKAKKNCFVTKVDIGEHYAII